MQKLRTTFRLIRIIVNKLKQDAVSAYAAQAAFFIMVSFFPFCMFLLTMVQFLPISETALTHAVNATFPTAFSPYILTIISEIYHSSTTAVVSATVITTLWAASKAFYSLIYGLNSVYNISENRNYFVLRLRALLYTLIFAMILLATLVLLGFGNTILRGINQFFPAFQDTTLLVVSLRASCLLCILVLYFLYVYVIVPNHRSRILWELPGAILTAIGWVGFSYLYSFYIDHLHDFSGTYGSLTAVVLLMLWLYACMYLLLIGGEINCCIRRFSVAKTLVNAQAPKQ